MKVLVVGNGGREHTLAWKLLQSPQVEQVFCAPGNAGTAAMARCQNLPLAVDDFAGIRDFSLANGIELVAVGPELPLSLGIADYLRANQIMVFGPNQAGAQLEASKSWAKAFMVEAGIPTAASATFTREEAAQAKAYVQQLGAPLVVKADGLAAGKGVCVARTEAEAIEAIESSFSGQFGAAGNIVVIEEFLTGQEASILALTDGEVIAPLRAAQDHKAIGEGDTGPNTGGMGAYAPTPVITPELMTQVQTEILEPTLATLRRRGIDYTGVIYAGLMISPTGEIKVLEFNCRFGDPETQAILPLLETPLDELMVACCSKSLAQLLPIRFTPEAAACVVMAAGGYPGDYEKGKIITGLEAANATGAQVFHAGTQMQGENIVTSGGRVLGVTATGETFAEALRRAYAAVDCIHFDGAYYRRDIGYRVTT